MKNSKDISMMRYKTDKFVVGVYVLVGVMILLQTFIIAWGALN